MRRRRSQRIREFIGHDRWLLCCVPSTDLETHKVYRRQSISVHVHQLAAGGQSIPFQPLGFLSLWAVTTDGRVSPHTPLSVLIYAPHLRLYIEVGFDVTIPKAINGMKVVF